MSDPAALALVPVVTAAARGDRDAFTRLVRETSGVVCAIALAVTRDVPTSEDVAQDVFLDAWKGMARLRNPASFLPWLRQLARNRARQAVRGGMRRRRRVTTDLPDALLDAAADPAPHALDGLVAAEERAALLAALDALPSSAREVLVLYYREGRSVRQTAELLGIGEDAVKQRLARARQRVRALLLEDAGRALARTAPGSAFVAAVAVALSAATPGVAAAATIGIGKTAATGKLLAKIGLGGVATGALLGVFGGLIGGLGGVFSGARKLHREARDEEERRGVRRYAAAGSALVLGFLGTMLVAPRREPVTASFLVMVAGFSWLGLVYIPRITARRRAAELLEDPTAAARHRREHRHAVLGCAVGFVLGAVPIVWMWSR